MTVFYFTATGNSLAVAKRIGGNLVSIPRVVDSGELRFRDDAIGVVFPIYGFREPQMVRRFLDGAKFEADYIFAIGTYGNMPGATMANLQRRAGENGCRFDYVNHLLMLDNFLPIFEIGAQIKKLPGKKVEEHAAKIADDIENRRHRHAKAGLGVRALTAALAAFVPVGGNAKKYIVSDSCGKCGVCAKVCPAKNIAVTDKIEFGGQCEGCLACLHLCPKNAMHMKNERSGKRWRNPEVSLNEIIEANCS